MDSTGKRASAVSMPSDEGVLYRCGGKKENHTRRRGDEASSPSCRSLGIPSLCGGVETQDNEATHGTGPPILLRRQF